MDEEINYKKKCKKYKKRIKNQKLVIEGLTMLVKKFKIKMKKEKDEIIKYLTTKELQNMSQIQIDNGNNVKEYKIMDNKLDSNITQSCNNTINKTTCTKNTNEQNNIKNNSYIEDNIKEILNKANKIEHDFKIKCTFSQFLVFCTETKLLAKDVKNVSIYVRNNKKGILRQLFRQINTTKSYDLYQIFWFLGHYLSTNEKLIICHDLFLFVFDRYKIVPFIYALYKNMPIFNGKLGETIKHLIMVQIDKDKEYCGDQHVIEFYNTIVVDLQLHYNPINLLDYAINLIVLQDVFVQNDINQTMLDAALSLKVACRHLEWQTTKQFLTNHLVPKLYIHPCYVFYFGTILTGYLYLLGEDESLLIFYSYLENLIDGESKIFGFVAYIFLKQIKLGKYDYWLEINKKYAGKYGVNVELIDNYV